MPPKRPNILLIVLDTVRRDRLGVYGCDRLTSPALDAFAADAALFWQAVSPAQWTVPAHAALFTGRYPGAHGVTEASHKLSGLHPTLAETLRAAGYHTVGFSNNPLVGVLDNDLTRGFTEFFVYAGAAVNRPLQRPGPLRRRWQRFARPTQNRFAHSDTLFRVSLNALLVPLWTRFMNYKGNTAQSVSDLIAYLQRHRATDGAPLFAFLNVMGAHLPYRPPQDALQAVAPTLSRDPHAAAFVRRFNAQAVRWASPDNPPLADWQRAALCAWYDAELRAQDTHLGRLFTYLQTSGALDSMLVLIVADHGEGHGDHGYLGHGFVVYQELVHVPLLVRWPGGLGRGARVTAPVSTRRIYHTALEAAGAAPPLDAADPNADVQGLSLTRALAGEADADSGAAFAEAYPPGTMVRLLERRVPHLVERLRLRDTRRAVYTEGWKLAAVGDVVEGLFHLASDPGERHDLAAAEPERAVALMARLQAFVAAQAMQSNGGALPAQADAAITASLRALGYIE